MENYKKAAEEASKSELKNELLWRLDTVGSDRMTTEEHLALCSVFGAHNYKPLDNVFKKAN